MTEIIDKLFQEYTAKIAHQLHNLESLKEEVLSYRIPSTTVPDVEPHEESLQTVNPTGHIEKCSESFLPPDGEVTKNILKFLESAIFSKVKGHEDARFDADYNYAGALKSNTSEIPIPPKSLINEIEKLDIYSDIGINQVIVNTNIQDQKATYQVPEHSDDETSIKPQSKIFTVSPGQVRAIKLQDKT